MPGIVQNRRKRPSVTPSDDSDEEESGYTSPASVGSKRARYEDASVDRTATNPAHNRNNASSQDGHMNGAVSEDTFPPGSLVRVKLTNFVTYTAAEFHLGPSLNMVIGPNGTGKSTLVCAICLGLGWSSEHLGRAKEIGLFVKNGSTTAEIEIELAAGPGRRNNPVVRRAIRKEDNKSIFWIDGKQVNKNVVLALCKEFSIQIDNLCQFLPQDRVVEFAKMTDVDRLRETQRAAAPPHMVEWHDQLRALRIEEKDLETKEGNERTHLLALERAQAAAQDDVDRFQQREGLLKKSKCLANVRPIIELRLRKKEYDQAKVDLVALRRELAQIQNDVEPAQQAQAEINAYRDQIDAVVKIRKNRVELIKKKADKLMTDIEGQKQSASGFSAEIKAEIDSTKERERDIVRTNAEIQRFERQRQEEPVAYDAEAYSQRMAELRSQISAVSNRLTEREDAATNNRSRGHGLAQEFRQTQHQRNQLNTQQGKQTSMLQKASPETAKAWQWIQENKHELNLRGEVFGPPILECSVRDARYADAVESQLRKGDLLAITFTNSDDQQLLSDRLFSLREGGPRLHDVYLRTSTKPLSAYRPQVAPAELANLGFDGYIIDYIQGPDAVLAMLCDNTKLDRTAYASRAFTDEDFASVAQSRIKKFVSDRELYQINTRREYGVSSTSVTQLRKAVYFVDQPANTDEIRDLEAKLRDLQEQAANIKRQAEAFKEEIAGLKNEQAKLKEERDGLQTEQDRVKRAVAEWNALPDKIRMKKQELEELNQENAQTNDRIRAIKASSRDASLKVAMLTLEYAKAVTQLRSFHESMIEAEIRLIDARSECNAWEQESREILETLQRKEAEILDLDRRVRSTKAELLRMRNTTQENLEALDDEEKQMIQEYSDLPSFDALEQEIAAVNARLEMMAEGNSGVLRQYNKRAEDIIKTREQLEEHAASLQSTQANIAQIRGHWEPELDELIAKISAAFAHNFEQIGCAGEVKVYKDEEDFENWSIQISVRFRDGESLSVLNSHRQSGGERAVSTIFYLMALQDLAQSPFRVVDEINQGMDPRNERMVHERMVDIACQERTSQYFLITPKLLTGLKFHPKMKVHIINSGEHIPDAKEAKTWDLKDMAKIALRNRKGVEVS